MTGAPAAPPTDRPASGMTPVLAIARSEVRSRWIGLVLIGLLAGIVGAVSVSGIALARRTTTAYERLGEATKVDDARGLVLAHPTLLDDIEGLPEVTASWTGGISIGKVDGENTFLGIIAGPREPSPIIKPLVLEGRLPRATGDPDVIEVALRDDFQREFHVPIGQTFAVRFLSEDDLFRFDTGFVGGEVHGPEATVRIVGTVRLGGGFSTLPPGYASSDALEAHPEVFIGGVYYVRLKGGAAGVDEFRASLDELTEDLEVPEEASEFQVADVTDTSIAKASVDNTALLLGRALLAFALATALVGGFAIVQALARHHTAAAAGRDVERAIGLTRVQQTGARLLSGLVPAGLATAVTAVGALLAARIEPIGAIHLYEPSPGTSINAAVLALGVVSVFAGVLGATALTGLARRRRRSGSSLRESALVGRVARLGGSPPTVLGLRFALEPGRGARAVPVRSAITGAMVGIAGVVAGLVFISSLDRLTSSPARSAIPFDVMVADVDAADLDAEVLDNPLVGDVSIAETSPIELDGRSVDGHALEDLRGSVDIGIDQGRLPRTPDEIALGLRIARQLGVEPGDTVTAARADGSERELSVVGLAVVPTFNGEELGLNALLTPEGLRANGAAAPFSGAVVQAAAGADVDELITFLGERFEADAQPKPVTVKNLEELGGLPAGVAAIVGSIAVFALANALVVAVRRRQRDLAVLRAMGLTRSQTAGAVAVMALTIVAVGGVVGLPVGMAIGATLWRATASGAFVLSDAHFRGDLLLLPLLGAVVIALIAAIIPGRQAAEQRAAIGLRSE